MQKILLEAIYYVKEIGIIKTILLVYQIDTCPVYFNFQYKVDILISINFPKCLPVQNISFSEKTFKCFGKYTY